MIFHPDPTNVDFVIHSRLPLFGQRRRLCYELIELISPPERGDEGAAEIQLQPNSS